MKIQYVSKYLTLANEGLVPEFNCPMDQGLLACNLDNEDNIYLYCLSCTYKTIVGIKKYDEMVQQVKKHS